MLEANQNRRMNRAHTNQKKVRTIPPKVRKIIYAKTGHGKDRCTTAS